MYNQNLFNPNYINFNQYEELLKQKAILEQQIKFEENQKIEISKMLKALNEYFDAAEKISPQYQNYAIDLCALEIMKRLSPK